MSSEYHAEMVRQIIDFDLTSKQVKELCESDPIEDNTEDPLEKLTASAVKMARVTQTINATMPQDLARALLRQEGDPNVAKARLQAMRRLILEAEKYLSDE